MIERRGKEWETEECVQREGKREERSWRSRGESAEGREMR